MSSLIPEKYYLFASLSALFVSYYLLTRNTPKSTTLDECQDSYPEITTSEYTITSAIDPSRTISWAEYGSPTGIPILFFHGGGCSRIIPIPSLKQTCLDAQVRVIALDRPGFGKTSPNIAGTSQNASYISDIVEVLLHENISQPISMIGYSLGGPAALRMAFFYPDKIKNLYLLAPMGFVPNLRATKGLMIETRVLHFMSRYCPWVLEMLWGVMGGELTDMPAYFNKFFSSTDPRDKELLFATKGTEELWITTTRECYRQGLNGMKMGLLGVAGKDAPMGLGFDVSKIKLGSASKVTIYHGRVDRFVGIEGSRVYLALLEKAGNDVELKEFPVEEESGGHFGILTKMNGVLESEGQLYRNCE